MSTDPEIRFGDAALTPAVLTRVGLVLFILAPALCIGALIVDFYT